MKTIFVCIIIFIGCSGSPEPPDLASVDRFITQGKLKQASNKIDTILHRADLDSITIRKLDHRRLLINKQMWFMPLANGLNRKDTSGLYQRIKLSKYSFSIYDTLKKRWFWHDYLSLLSQYYLLKKDSAKWLDYGQKALTYPAQIPMREVARMQDFAFYYARKKKFGKAREWMDRAARSFDKKSFSPALLEVYQAYVDGKYSQAYKYLRRIPSEKKQVHWQRMEQFFKLYKDSLNQKNRYRLW